MLLDVNDVHLRIVGVVDSQVLPEPVLHRVPDVQTILREGIVHKRDHSLCRVSNRFPSLVCRHHTPTIPRHMPR